MNIQENNRTSQNQLLWINNALSGFLRSCFTHLNKFSLGYGFLFGATSTLLTVAAIIWYGVLAYPLPWKVTDPRDPRFDINQFRFSDYSKDADLYDALKFIIKDGKTTKHQVDALLSKIAKADVKQYFKLRPTDSSDDIKFYYTYRNIRSILLEHLTMMPEGEFTWEVFIVFDKNEKVKDMKVI